MPMRMGIILSVLMIACAIAEEPVYFADANLKTAVEEKLGKTNPTPTDMLALKDLLAYGKGIADLTGIEYATNLQELNLYGNQISDLSPLSGLTGLSTLWLGANQISAEVGTVPEESKENAVPTCEAFLHKFPKAKYIASARRHGLSFCS